MSLSIGSANEHRNVHFIRGGNNCLQQGEISNIEMAKGGAF